MNVCSDSILHCMHEYRLVVLAAFEFIELSSQVFHFLLFHHRCFSNLFMHCALSTHFMIPADCHVSEMTLRRNMRLSHSNFTTVSL